MEPVSMDNIPWTTFTARVEDGIVSVPLARQTTEAFTHWLAALSPHNAHLEVTKQKIGFYALQWLLDAPQATRDLAGKDLYFLRYLAHLVIV